MNNETLILQELQKMNARMDSMESQIGTQFKAIHERLDTVENKLDNLIEEHAITRDTLNRVAAWADKCSEAVILPLPKI